MLNRYFADMDLDAVISRQGVHARWAKTTMIVPASDLFETRPKALAEFRRRRDGL